MSTSSALQALLSSSVIAGLAPLVASYFLALPIAWNREREARSAGLRTFPLVALASCAFIQATEPLIAGDANAIARVTEGVITGIGFVGGGAIIQIKDRVEGTATAASLWATGAVGVAIALEAYDVAIAVSLITFATLGVLTPLKGTTQSAGDGSS